MSDETTPEELPVVALGASAGGLETCRTLLRAMPGDAPAAFLLVLHLDPTHDSMMVDLLARHTGMRVVQAAEGMALRPGTLHVIPPGVFMTVSRRVLHLAEPEAGKAVRLPFDVLLRSLAGDAPAATAGVVLSGTGTDGCAGLASLSAAGGLVIAQDPAEASYAGMPESAIATGLVDRVLRIEAMAAALAGFRGVPSAAATSDEPAAGDDDAAPSSADYDAVVAFLGEHAVQDISLYKRGTLERRIARRMAMVGLGPGEMARYLDLLRGDAGERAQLTADLLIHVTHFFRDPAVFDHLSQKAVPGLLAAMPPDRPMRVWVAGCSTGEEAYSIAMICLEALEAAGSGARLQILASDIDPDAIATARAGFYSRDIEAAVSSDRLKRFFMPRDGGWRVTSALRDVIVFTVADLLSDPPFSRIDLVSCRNVLIYLGPEAQQRVVARCCFALRRGGLLLLGAAEMPGQADGCFAVEDKGARLWRRVGQTTPGDLQFAAGRREEAPADHAQNPVRRSALGDLCRRIVLENYAPAAVLLNDRLDCLYLLGPTEKFLAITQGHPDPGVLGMLPKVLRARFRAAVASCGPTAPRITVTGARIPGSPRFDIALHFVHAGAEPLYLACFIDAAEPAGAEGADAAGQPGHSGDMEAELTALRADLAEALRDLEREVESHGSDAAEALSVNEEFQSTNEELLASKEELQSLNEELTALNSQLQETLERHRTTANDLQNVLFSTDVATLFLDLDLNIRFFTPAARAIFRVIPSDVGRPLADLAAVLRDDDLERDAREVLAARPPQERELQGAGDQWFLRRVLPYRAEGDRIEGVVITYLDISERKRANAELRAAMDEAERATRAKTRFLAAASHDLRQPLQSMALLHRLLAGQKRTTEGMRLASLMDQTLHSMAEMLDSMLDANRIESGVVRAQMRPMPIAPMMRRLTKEFGPQCELKGLNLRCVHSSAWVHSDPQLLEQMLRNLMSNAVKYTPEGSILLGCRRRGGALTIVVCDTGIGVSVSEAEAIFDAYRQGDKAAALAGPGLGLGLSIVQRLGQLMGHQVSLRSTRDRGSSFMVTVPLAEAGQEVAPPEPPRRLPRADRLTGTILLVEDEDPLRDLLAEVLTKEGHEVIARADAHGALAWASGDVARPDLLLTDFDLHGATSGLRLAQDLTHVLGEPVPTIILTGDITTETLKIIGNSDCRQVAKPVMPEVLLAQISDLMARSRGARTRAARRSDTAGMQVHVIDDDPMIRKTMCRLFEAEGWGVVTHASAEEFLAAPRPVGDACLLVDHLLPGMDGVALIALLRGQRSPLPAVMLTAHGDAAMAVAAMKAGASDLIEKPARAVDLLASVRHAVAARGGGRAQTDARKAAQERFADLTARERDVLMRVLAGAPNKIIAADLGINQRTVENHRASVMRKTDADSLPALVRLALAAGLQDD